MKFSGACSRNAPIAVDPPALVGEAIEDLFQGVRTIPLNVGIRQGLQFIIKSKLSHLFAALGNKLREAVTHDEVDESEGEESAPLTSLADFQRTLWDVDDPNSPAEIVEQREIVERFLEFCRGDTLLTAVLTLSRDENFYKPAEAVAARLNVSVEEIYNAHRRLEGRLVAFKDLPE